MKLLTIFILLFLSFTSLAQCEESSAAFKFKKYTSLEQAMLEPDSVFYLDLSRSKLRQLPQDVYAFKNLTVLILDRNRLVEIPEKIGNLRCLKTLSVERNKLERIDNGVFRLKHLEHLNLSNNEIRAIPLSLMHQQFL